VSQTHRKHGKRIWNRTALRKMRKIEWWLFIPEHARLYMRFHYAKLMLSLRDTWRYYTGVVYSDITWHRRHTWSMALLLWPPREACMGKVLSGTQGCKLVKLVQKIAWRPADEKLNLSDFFYSSTTIRYEMASSNGCLLPLSP
jgi:hypothetical protein